jgi:hypothetical protein
LHVADFEPPVWVAYRNCQLAAGVHGPHCDGAHLFPYEISQRASIWDAPRLPPADRPPVEAPHLRPRALGSADCQGGVCGVSPPAAHLRTRLLPGQQHRHLYRNFSQKKVHLAFPDSFATTAGVPMALVRQRFWQWCLVRLVLLSAPYSGQGCDESVARSAWLEPVHRPLHCATFKLRHALGTHGVTRLRLGEAATCANKVYATDRDAGRRCLQQDACAALAAAPSSTSSPSRTCPPSPSSPSSPPALLRGARAPFVVSDARSSFLPLPPPGLASVVALQ